LQKFDQETNMKKNVWFISWLWLLGLLVVTSCGGDEPGETTPVSDSGQSVSAEDTVVPSPTPEAAEAETIYGQANVDSIQVLILESFPVQVNVVARGEFSNGCTTIDEILTEMNDNTFEVTITTVSPGDVACTEALVPFDETIPLDVLGLSAGRYTVTVNGITGSFTLDIDNQSPPEEVDAPTPEPTATPEPSDSAVIGGRVWHDLCAVAGGEGGEEVVPSNGCIALADGSTFQANGLLEAGEPGIENVLISLAEGECPGSELATAVSDADGEYRFSELPAGTYCVTADALAEPNREVLLPGNWTHPGQDEFSVSVSVSDGESLANVNFGWDFQFLPLPEVDLETCTNSIAFVEDLSIPDDTVLAPGEEFVKSWRLRNNGTCPWTTEYSLVSLGGDGIPGPESLPLSSAVAPGQTVDLSVTLTAPDELGTYRDNWQLSDANEVRFGVNSLVEEAFWVQIVVAVPGPTPIPNSASIGGVVWRDSCFLQTDGSPSVGCVETEEGSGIYIGDGSLNFNESRIPELVVTLSAGVCPTEEAISPGDTLATTTTDEDGLYRFESLDQGSYCVSIDAFREENVDLLIPGDWTWPAPGVGQTSLTLDAGEALLDIDFGWDDR
jgi:hypothetical protein